VALGGERYSSYSFLTSALHGGEWSASRPATLCPRERTPGSLCSGGWVGLRAGLDTEATGKILCPCRGLNPDHPVVQSVVRHYTDWATPASLEQVEGWKGSWPPWCVWKGKDSEESLHPRQKKRTWHASLAPWGVFLYIVLVFWFWVPWWELVAS
jgi:hypothetical protein